MGASAARAMPTSPVDPPVHEDASLGEVLVPFAAASGFLGLIQILTLAISVVGLRVTRPVAVLVLAAAALVAAWFAAQVGAATKRDHAAEQIPSSSGWVDRGLSALVVMVSLWAAWVWLDLLRLAWHRPPSFWDSLLYHIPAIHDWVRQGRVGFIHSLPDIPWVTGVMGVEVTAFLVHQVGRTTRLVEALNLWYWPLGWTALAVIANEFGARGIWRWLAGALLFSSPVFVSQGATAYIDAGFATTVMGSLAAACISVSPAMRGRWWAPVLLGLNVGLMLGAKASGLPYAVVLIVLVSVVLIWLRTDDWFRSVALPLLVCVALATAVGSYWYVRNALETGNPVSPYRLTFGQKVLGEGFDQKFLTGNWSRPEAIAGYPEWSWRFAAWLPPASPSYGPVGSGSRPNTGGLGYFWLAGALPSVACLWFITLRRRPRQHGIALALVTAMTCALFMIQPAPWHARYTLWLLGLGLPCFAAVVHDAATRWRSRRGHLAVLALGAAAVTLAVWESQRTLALEWRVGREAGIRGLRSEFPSTLDAFFPGMSEAAGFKDFLSADTIARGHWSRKQHNGTLLGGMLAMPLGARRILVLPAATFEEVRDPYRVATHRRPPSASDITRAQDEGADWFLWEADDADDVPESLTRFTGHYRYRVTEDVSFHLVSIGRQPDQRVGARVAATEGSR